MEKFEIVVDRRAPSEECLMGYLSIGGSAICYTLERPYVDGRAPFSAVRAGSYSAFIRTDGAKGWRLELVDVPNKTNIQIHVGNYPADTQGCVLVGLEADAKKCTLGQSKAARDLIKNKLEEAGVGDEAEITVTLIDSA